MTKSLVRSILLGAAALALAGPAAAQSKVGVTSATDGDPLGKPPTQNERVLRIGIDVQANEVVSTHANDRAHLVFLDGTSLTVGPNARLTIDRFVYDPNTKQGDLAISATEGVFRLVGGKISKTKDITIKTPSSTIAIRGGILILNVSQLRTVVDFIFGHYMLVTALRDLTRVDVTRPGSQVVVNNGARPIVSLLPPGALNNVIGQLETGNSSSSSSGGTADQKSQSSGYSAGNSGQPQNPPGTPPGTNPGNPPNTNNNSTTQAVSNSNGASNPQDNNTTTPNQPTPAPTPPPPPPPPAPKTTQTLKGYVGGLIDISSGGESPVTVTAPLSGAKPGDLKIKTNADKSTVKATIIIRGLDGEITSPTAKLNLGTGKNGISFFQDNLNFVTASVDGRATINADGAKIKARDTSVLVTAAVIPGLSPVGTGCTCDFLTFGEWATVITPKGKGDVLGGASAVVTLAPWVAGTPATQLPNTQSANFSGGMWGQAQNGNSASRSVTGNFTLGYNWGQGSGAWNANFDNRTYAGNVSGTKGVSFGNNSIPATVGNNTMSVNGSFFTGAGAGGAVVGVGGQFGATGPGYQASGVFGGAKK